MKKLLLMTLAVIALSITSCEKDGIARVYTICDTGQILAASERNNETTLNPNDLMSQIQGYVTTEFAGYLIQSVSSYEDANSTTYIELVMNNSGILLFSNEGNFICGDNSFQYGEEDDYIAIEDLPTAITEYIQTNYPNATIKGASFEDNEYEVELNNGKELYFDKNGNFLREE